MKNVINQPITLALEGGSIVMDLSILVVSNNPRKSNSVMRAASSGCEGTSTNIVTIFSTDFSMAAERMDQLETNVVICDCHLEWRSLLDKFKEGNGKKKVFLLLHEGRAEKRNLLAQGNLQGVDDFLCLHNIIRRKYLICETIYEVLRSRKKT